jgi:hypothetical protein
VIPGIQNMHFAYTLQIQTLRGHLRTDHGEQAESLPLQRAG